MKKLTSKQYRLTSLLLFSMFFGAGNLIFPPLVGRLAGHETWWTMLAFGVTAVVLPVLGVVAVSKSKGLMNLAGRVHPVFAVFFTIVIYMSIGPFLGIPRAGSLPFVMAVQPYLPKSVPMDLALLAYTVIFFLVAFWLCVTPSKLLDRVGKVLTPTLLMLMLILFVASLIHPLGSYQAATGSYASSPLLQGFVDGYQTMDAVAALNFGLVITQVIEGLGISQQDSPKVTLRAGLGAGTILMLIYLMLAHLGASSAGVLSAENGAEILRGVANQLFGGLGAILMALIFTLACLTTCVGLLSSISQYFYSLTKKGSYKAWLVMWVVISTILANFGLNQILAYSVAVLVAIYPVAIILILLGNSPIESKLTYRLTVGVAGAISLVQMLASLNLPIPVLYNLYLQLPLANLGLAWALPSVIAFGLGMAIDWLKKA